MSRKDDIKKLITKHNRNLQKLKEQQASLGLHTPSHILTEIEDAEAEIERLQIELTESESIAKVTSSIEGVAFIKSFLQFVHPNTRLYRK